MRSKGCALERVGTLGLHGLVDEQAEALGKAVGAFVREELQHGLEELRMREVGHVRFGCWCFRDTPTRTHVAHPLPDNEGGISPAGAAAQRQSNLQKDFYTPQ